MTFRVTKRLAHSRKPVPALLIMASRAAAVFCFTLSGVAGEDA
jgi:hypothetical protein